MARMVSVVKVISTSTSAPKLNPRRTAEQSEGDKTVGVDPTVITAGEIQIKDSLPKDFSDKL